jgi:hypothetical protein
VGIEPGANFAEILNDRVGDCDASLALIGLRWLTPASCWALCRQAKIVY